MSSPVAIDPAVAGVIIGLAIVTYLTKIGGLWLVSRVEVSDRLKVGLEVLPGAIIIAVLGPELADGGPPEWAAASVVAVVAWRTRNIVLALGVGVVAAVVFRTTL